MPKMRCVVCRSGTRSEGLFNTALPFLLGAFLISFLVFNIAKEVPLKKLPVLLGGELFMILYE